MTALDRFFESYYRLRPVNATFTGVHDHDHRLPDWSPEGLEASRTEMLQLRAELETPAAPRAARGGREPTLARNRVRAKAGRAISPRCATWRPATVRWPRPSSTFSSRKTRVSISHEATRRLPPARRSSARSA